MKYVKIVLIVLGALFVLNFVMSVYVNQNAAGAGA